MGKSWVITQGVTPQLTFHPPPNHEDFAMGKRFNGGKKPPRQQFQPVHEYASVRGRGRRVDISYDSSLSLERQGGLIEKALRRLNRQVRDDGVLAEVEGRKTFTKPNEARRIDAKRAKQREKRRQEASKPKRQTFGKKGARHGR